MAKEEIIDVATDPSYKHVFNEDPEGRWQRHLNRFGIKKKMVK